MARKSNAVITGCNRGIGLALAQNYANEGYEVTAIVRRSSPALEAIATTIIDDIELTDAENIASVASKLEGKTIDLLLNVAGIMLWEHSLILVVQEQRWPRKIGQRYKWIPSLI